MSLIRDPELLAFATVLLRLVLAGSRYLPGVAADDIKTLLREFKASVSADLTATHQRMDHLEDEVRQRLRTMETAILNAIRDTSRETSRRFEDVDRRFDEMGDEMGRRFDEHDRRFDELGRRLDEHEDEHEREA